jgi:hypothetical protein
MLGFCFESWPAGVATDLGWDSDGVLERFRAKWTPVRVKKMRPNNKLELPF